MSFNVLILQRSLGIQTIRDDYTGEQYEYHAKAVYAGGTN